MLVDFFLSGRLFVFFFFFFQAEDGIRDWSVTGVQTCALPIFTPKDDTPAQNAAHLLLGSARPITPPRPSEFRREPEKARSEERRVGKSVDLGGRRIIKKKKRK